MKVEAGIIASGSEATILSFIDDNCSVSLVFQLVYGTKTILLKLFASWYCIPQAAKCFYDVKEHIIEVLPMPKLSPELHVSAHRSSVR